RLLDTVPVEGGPPSEAEPEPSPAVRYNAQLNRHLLFRELFRFDLTAQERAECEASALPMGKDSMLVAEEAAAFGAEYRKVSDPERTESSVPTYLLSGLLDPLDPPDWAEEFALTLTRGELVQVKWAGHSTLRYLDWSEGGC